MGVEVTMVAEWMIQRLEEEKVLYQDEAVSEIVSRFGAQFTYINRNGNMAINREVLAEFRTLTGDQVVWQRDQRMWRCRQPSDPAGKRGVD